MTVEGYSVITAQPMCEGGVLGEVLAEARQAARDQLAAAWQLQVARVEEELARGWREQLAQVFEERFEEIGRRLEEEFHRRVEAALEEGVTRARAETRRELAGRLTQAGRRLRGAENQAEWVQALMDAAAPFRATALLFSVTEHWLKLEAGAGLAEDKLQELMNQRLPLIAAPAFSSAVESRDTVVAVRTAAELSATLAGAVGEDPAERVILFPLAVRDRVMAVLYADPAGEPGDPLMLEAVAVLAAAALEARVVAAQAGLAPVVGSLRRRPAPEWAALCSEEQESHVRAQRFARVRVAEMRLYKAREVSAGRAGRNLYLALKLEIDNAREVFRRQFLDGSATMVDYFDLELVRTLANDDPTLLGPEYPGPLA